MTIETSQPLLLTVKQVAKTLGLSRRCEQQGMLVTSPQQTLEQFLGQW